MKRSGIKKGKGFSASPQQRAKVKGQPCIVSGHIPADPAHIYDRSLGGCDDPLCVVPLSRSIHRAYDDGNFDLLPYLLDAGCYAEMAHVIEAHHVSPITLVKRLTNDRSGTNH